jgi:hypothetical protein
MGCHSATISYPLLNQLSTLHYDGFQELNAERIKPAHVYKCPKPLTWRLEGLAARCPENMLDFDYLADGGKPLTRAIEEDQTARTWMTAALNMFIDAEKKSKAKIEDAISMTQEIGCSL